MFPIRLNTYLVFLILTSCLARCHAKVKQSNDHMLNKHYTLLHCNYMKYACTVGIICFYFCNFLNAQTINVDKGKISFLSDAPLEKIEASTNKIKGIITLQDQKLAFKLEISSFQGFNSPLQREHFNENYMQSHQFPDAQFTGKIIEELDWQKDGTYPVRVKGQLTMKGISVEKIIKGTISINKGQIRILSEFKVLLSDYDIKIPKVVFQKIAEEILVTVDLQMKMKS